MMTRVFESVDAATRHKSAADHNYCNWFMLCANPATAIEKHPVLGKVPVCEKCHEFIHAGEKS